MVIGTMGSVAKVPDRTKTEAPARSLAKRQIILGAVIFACGLAAAPLGATVGVAMAIVGGLLVGLGILVRMSGDAVPTVNRAFNAALAGRAAEAEALLDEAEARYQLPYIRRVIDLQRAGLAVRKGDLDAALPRVEAAIARRPGLLSAQQDRIHIAGAHAMRALIRASKGDRAGARADIAFVRASGEAPPEALARAEVAEAIAIEGEGDREALAAHLAKERRLLLDYTAPRERAVVRAYQRMLKAPKTTVYRRAAPRDEEARAGDEPTVADWIAKIAPAAAPFVRVARPSGSPAITAPEAGREVEPGLLKVAEERLRGARAGAVRLRAAKVLLLWVLLVALFVAIWQLLDTEPQARHAVNAAPAVPSALFLNVLGTALPALFVGIVVLGTVRAVKQGRRTLEAAQGIAKGDARAIADFEALTKVRQPSVQAQAHFELARVAERKADFAEALKRCDLGIAAATASEATRTVTSAILLPDLIAERAFVLATTDRHDKALAEMAVLAERFPSYPYRARAELVVALVQRVRKGDLEGAAALVEGRAEDMPLSLRHETLADLVRATVHPEAAGAGEIERLKEDLRVDPELRAWLEAVAPALLRAFSGAEERAAREHAVAREESDRDHQAELEALAEEEAGIARRAVSP
jgi:hypothetical protein